MMPTDLEEARVVCSERLFETRVSDPLFRLITEGMRLLSNDQGRFATLAQLVECRRETVLLSLKRHEAAALRGHFDTAPSTGTIAVACTLSRANADCLERVRQWLTAELAFEATVTDAVSALVFDYAVEQSTARLLRDMGLSKTPTDATDPGDREDPTKVVPLR